jgi:TolA-binding protein
MQTGSTASQSQEDMQDRIQKLEGEVRELKAIVKQLQSGSASPASDTNSTGVVEDKIAPERQNLVQPEDRKISYMRRIERPY